MGHRASRLALGVLCLFLGLALVVQFRTQETVQKSTLAPADQAQVVTNLVESNATLRREIAQLESQIASYYEDNGGGSLEAMVQELNRVKMLNGLVELNGPGVEVIVSAPPSVEEMHDLINELRNAGAEAMREKAYRVEKLSQEGSPEEMQKAFQDLVDQFERTRRMLEDYLDPAAAAGAGGSGA